MLCDFLKIPWIINLWIYHSWYLYIKKKPKNIFNNLLKSMRFKVWEKCHYFFTWCLHHMPFLLLFSHWNHYKCFSKPYENRMNFSPFLHRGPLYISLSPKCPSVFMFLLGFPFRTCPSWAGTHSSFIAGYCAQCEDLLKLELFLEERRVQRWRIMGKLVWVCAFLPKYGLSFSFLSFLCLFTSRLSVQFLFCSFIWDWRGGFSLSKAVLFAGELWHACSGWLKLSEQSLLVSAPCPGGRPYPEYPLLAHRRPGSRLVCWRVVQSHLRERWTCETWFCTLG